MSFNLDEEGGSSPSSNFTPTFDPINPLPVEPGKEPVKTPRQQDERHTYGVASASVSIAGPTPVFVGRDPFGNPIYDFTGGNQVIRQYYDLNPGWNTRATIPEPIGATMYLSYASGSAIGAIVGLTENPAATVGYDDIILGWMTLRGVAHIISRGQILFQLPEADTMPDPGSYNRDVDQLVMRKTVNRVEFFLSSQDGQGGEVKIGEAFMSEPVTYVSAALYLGGDVINNEVLEYPEVIAGSFPPITGGIFESGSATYIRGSFPSITGEVYENDLTVIASSFPSITGFMGDYANTFIRGAFPSITGEITSYSDYGEVPEFNYTFAAFPSIVGAMMVRDVTFGQIDSEFRSISGFAADGDISVIRGSFPSIRGGMYEERHPGRLTLVSFAYMNSQIPMRSTTFLVLNSSMQVVAAFTITELQRLLIESEMQAGDSATLTAIIRELLSSTMSAGDVAALQRDGMSVWALHMDAMGSTRYEGFDFNSFMTIDGQTYGVNATGIHRLGGNRDDDALIPASVDFGSLSFGTNNRKALPYVYVGMASSGRTVLKIEADGATYYYTARDSTELMKSHRFEPGRGLRASFYGLTLMTDGETFDLHNIDFQPVELKRSL